MPTLSRVVPAARLALAAALVVPLVVAGCRESNAPEPSAPLIPPAVGRHWQYEISDSVEVGTPLGLQPDRVNVRVVGDTTIRGERWAVLDSAQVILHDNHAGRYYLRSRADGIYENTPPDAGFPIVGGTPGYRIFKYPVRLGEQGGLPFVGVLWTVSAVDTLVRVPAGEFRCVRYDEGEFVTWFVAPGVGIVQKVTGIAETRDANGQLIRRTRLVYRLTARG